MTSLNQQKFVELFAQYQNRVYAYVRTLLPNHSDAEEVFQQTVLILWKKWDQFDDTRDFVSWACGFAHNEARNFLRKHDRRNEYLSDEAMELISQATAQKNDWLEARGLALNSCLEKLSQRDRNLVERCYHGNEKIREVAMQLGFSDNVLYKNLRKVRKSLFECVDRELAKEQAS